MMILNISGRPLDESMLRVIAMIPGLDCYVPFEVIEDEYIKLFQNVSRQLVTLLTQQRIAEMIPLHNALMDIKDILEDINTIKNFQEIYDDVYKHLEDGEYK